MFMRHRAAVEDYATKMPLVYRRRLFFARHLLIVLVLVEVTDASLWGRSQPRSPSCLLAAARGHRLSIADFISRRGDDGPR